MPDRSDPRSPAGSGARSGAGAPAGPRAGSPAGPRAGSPTGSPARTAAHDERLWLGPLGWACVAALAVVMVVALWPVGVTPALLGGAVVLAIGIGAGVALATPVRVVDGELWAGQAHLPLDVVGEVRALDARATREELGPHLDARAHVCLRAWARTAVRVEVVDPDDPTPYWLVSTRRPARLAAAVIAGRDRPAAQGR